LGALTARGYAAQGGGARKIAEAGFPRKSGGSGFALLYVDPRDGRARLRLSATADSAAFLAGLVKNSRAKTIRYSVISPVYNVEKYLDAFFESVTGQSLAFKSTIELIMVDDGSTDGSAKIIKRWQKKFPQNIKYLHKENGGISSARNMGLAAASHDWITFID